MNPSTLVVVITLVSSPGLLAQECPADSGAPHASTTVVYGGVDAQVTVLTPSREGTIRATDAASSATLWEFTPPDIDATARGDLITDLRVLRFDANNDDVINIADGDKVWVYFGAGDGGAFYYALDISIRDKPTLLWQLDADALEGLTHAWATPTIARMTIGGARQNGEQLVLILAGGTRLFVVDAQTGNLLWSTDEEAADTFVARVAALDTDGDAFADRVYAINIAGQLWRFDIDNGEPASALATAAILADLSDGSEFVHAPDVSFMQPLVGTPYYNIAVGSERFFYSVRDRDPFAPIDADALIDISASPGEIDVPPNASGWKLALRGSDDPTATGEYVVGESVTADGIVMFTTFQRAGGDPCAVEGIARVYAVRLDTAATALDLNDDGELTADDLAAELPTTTTPPALIIVPGNALNSVLPSDPTAPDDIASDHAFKCVIGTRVLSKCVTAGALIRTWWQRPSIK